MRSRTWLAALTASVLAVLSVPSLAGAAPAPDVPPGGYRFEAPPGVTFTLPGLGRFADTIEVFPGPDGDLVVVNELSMDGYLEGLGEVPASWHEQALQAQAVAARTYAWYSILTGYHREHGLDFDICGTVDCQVFSGRAIVEAPGVGRRWADAVAATSGEVLVYEDRPIMARFHASSGGTTRNNIDVFPDDGDLPYLRSVDDPGDAVSPLHRWQVTFTRQQMDAILARGQSLRAAVPAVAFELVPADYHHPDGRTDRVRITRADGHQVEISASKFRAWVSDVAPQLFPGRYPEPRADGGSMPFTLPSSMYDFEVTPTQVVVHGGGFGHGVGMSQYGAKGMAEAGTDHADILAHYYGGIQPTIPDALPDRVRVGLTWEADQVTVRADGPVRVLTPGREAAAGPGSFSFARHGADAMLADGPALTWSPREAPSRRTEIPDPLPDPHLVADRARSQTDEALRRVVGAFLRALPLVGLPA